MKNAEKRGKRQVMIRPFSKAIIKFHLVMHKHGYIGEFEYVDDHRSRKIVVELNGRLNKCGVISPRFDIGVKTIEPWTARLLPSRQFGYIVLTTSAGIKDHEEARRKMLVVKYSGSSTRKVIVWQCYLRDISSRLFSLVFQFPIENFAAMLCRIVAMFFYWFTVLTFPDCQLLYILLRVGVDELIVNYAY